MFPKTQGPLGTMVGRLGGWGSRSLGLEGTGTWAYDGQKLCLLGPMSFLVALFSLHMMCFFLSLFLCISQESLVVSDRKPNPKWLEKRREFKDPPKGESRCTHNLLAMLLLCGLHSRDTLLSCGAHQLSFTSS